MIAIEVDEQFVPDNLYKEERGAISFVFDLRGGERVVVVMFDGDMKPVRFDCYTAKATAANKPMLYQSTFGRAFSAEERNVLTGSDVFRASTPEGL